MAKKAVSKEEKLRRMKELLEDKKDVFLLKELEVVASKEKGIVAKTVEEVVKELVGDGKIMTDKIGSSNFFWAFPSASIVERRTECENLQTKIDETKDKTQKVKEENEALKKERKGDDDRGTNIKQLEQLKQKREELTTTIKTQQENDPEVIEKLTNDCTKAKEAANRWTDAIFNVQSYAKSKAVGAEPTELNKALGIPNELDYID
ncbi:meiotic coiled-coil protein, putative [Entamoeba invadens IP1]|uniref:Meiotic coiled-coil protein, putative n=1 Tax=Entamoeba invadens TaxID=33085 RepID=S0B822_ENTIV|nr:meiotic coiled-coil protein, putative [Entamoeba invadens IP1]ELP85122.1 meiotic coiled-coil protein, putative [Entamoeba invadens IP1]BAN42192.1 meiotic coiled-coil protein, putative [Entamoeba invadens]|eukprot:XP_004184468.1 meiotic coiled-coil protein, putative [Entamoeba invadens IP1]